MLNRNNERIGFIRLHHRGYDLEFNQYIDNEFPCVGFRDNDDVEKYATLDITFEDIHEMYNLINLLEEMVNHCKKRSQGWRIEDFK